jgi:hypothetical protein
LHFLHRYKKGMPLGMPFLRDSSGNSAENGYRHFVDVHFPCLPYARRVQKKRTSSEAAKEKPPIP